jgi:hypothetical protein
MGSLMLLENPYFLRKHKKSRRNNPMSMSISKYTGGVDTMDIVGGAAGLAGATLIPNYIFKALGQTAPNKWIKVAVAAAITIGLGMAAKKWYPKVSKGLVIGGLAGTASQAIFNLTGTNIGRGIAQNANYNQPRSAMPGPAIASRGIGQTTKPEFEGMPSL